MSEPWHYVCSCGTWLPIENLVEVPRTGDSKHEYPGALRFDSVGTHRCLVWRHDGDKHEEVVEDVGPTHHQVPGCVVYGVIYAWHDPDRRRPPSASIVYAEEGATCRRCGAVAGIETFQFGDWPVQRNFWMRPKEEV